MSSSFRYMDMARVEEELADIVRALRVAEPELGVKAIARRLSVAHPSVDARAVRDALADPAQPSQPAAQPAAVASSSVDEVTPRVTQAPLEPTVAEEGPPTRFRRVKLAWPLATMGEDRMGLDGLHAIVGGREAGAPGLPPAAEGVRGVRLLETHPMQSHIMQMSEKYMETVAHPERPCFGALYRGEPLMSIMSRVNSTKGLSGYAEQMYEEIWSGENISLHFAHPGNDRRKGFLTASLPPEAGLPGNDKKLRFSILVEVKPSGDGGSIFDLGGHHGSYLEELSDDLFMPLARRMLHLALRSLDFDLGPALRNLCERNLIPNYRNEKRFAELVDLYLLLLDSALANDYAGTRLQTSGAVLHSELEAELAEVLEATGRFEDAAQLYTEAGRVLLAHATDTNAASMHLNNGGLAYKRAACFDQAEELYLEGLRAELISKPPALNKVPASSKCGLRNLAMLYECSAAAKTAGPDDASLDAVFDASEDEARDALKPGGVLDKALNAKLERGGREMKLSETLQALLGASDIFRDDQSDGFAVSISKKTCQRKNALLPQFRSKRAAARALLEAMASSTVAVFQQTLLACSDPKVTSVRVGIDVPSVKQEQSAARAQARFSNAGGHNETRLRSVCATCSAKWNTIPRDIFKPCPCMLVAYCSVACQTAGWEAHKQVHRQTMAARKASGTSY